MGRDWMGQDVSYWQWNICQPYLSIEKQTKTIASRPKFSSQLDLMANNK